MYISVLSGLVNILGPAEAATGIGNALPMKKVTIDQLNITTKKAGATVFARKGLRPSRASRYLPGGNKLDSTN